MRILVYCGNYAPELTGVGKYAGEMVSWLSQEGHDVRVVTTPPHYPAWRVAPGYKTHLYQRETTSSGIVIRCPVWVPRHASGVRRLVHLFSFAVSSFPVLLLQWRWKPDVVWVVEPSFLCAPGALVFTWLARAKSWLHIQDFEVDAAFEMGLLRSKMLRRAVVFWEQWTLRRFHRVSSISSRMMERAKSKGVSDTQLVYFPNWADIAGIKPRVTSAYRDELLLAKDSVVALYSGNMGNKQGLGILAEVARLLQREPRLKFVFCGEGSGREELREQCRDLSNVIFLNLQPLARLGELLSLADIHLLPQRADAADLVLPSKLTGMLASGRPVVVTAGQDTELAEIVQTRANCGVVVPPEEPSAFADAVLDLARDQVRRVRLGSNGREFAERELDFAAVLRQFDNELRTLVKLKLTPFRGRLSVTEEESEIA